MQETDRIRDQLRRAYEGPAWHGPSVKEVLSGVDEQMAARKVIPNAHSIWEIVNHIAGWTDVVSARLKGDSISEPVPGDFPPAAEPDPDGWKKTLAWLHESHKELQNAIAAIPESKLDESAPGLPKGAFYGTLHGTVQHYLYHAGQIALLKKAPS
jgi:hypothetical protein